MTLGDLHKPEVVLAVIGFIVVAVLSVLQVKGALLIGIMAVTVLSFIFAGNTFHGIVSMPPRWSRPSSRSTSRRRCRAAS